MLNNIGKETAVIVRNTQCKQAALAYCAPAVFKDDCGTLTHLSAPKWWKISS